MIALQEFESWLIAGVESLAGVNLPDGRAGVREGVTKPESDLEVSPRDAKRWLSRHMTAGYKPTIDQASLTSLVDIEQIRATSMRSFSRFEGAIAQIVEAVRTGAHIVSPEQPR